MLKQLSKLALLIIISGNTAAQTSMPPTDQLPAGVRAFVAHGNHCDWYVAGRGITWEAASLTTTQVFGDAMDALAKAGKSDKAAAAELERLCRQKIARTGASQSLQAGNSATQ